MGVLAMQNGSVCRRAGWGAFGAVVLSRPEQWRWTLAALLALGLISSCWQGASGVRAEPARQARAEELVVVPRAVAQATSVAHGLEARYSEVQTLAVGLSGKVLLVH